MPVDRETEPGTTVRSPTRADFYAYEERHREPVEGRSWVAVDRTMAMVLGGIASAALAVAVAGGSALVEKVDETVKDVQKSRTERIENIAEVSKDIGIVETKLSQLITQLTQLELRLERTMSHELEVRDKKIESLERELAEQRQRLNEFGYRRAR